MKFRKPSKDVRILGMLFVLAVAFYVISSATGNKQHWCTSAGGNWLKKYRECENVSFKDCFNGGGFYNFCARDCRHFREESIADPCDLKCVKVCEFVNFGE